MWNFNSFAWYIMHRLSSIVLPVVEDAVDHQPLHLDTVAADLLLHAGNKRVLVLPFAAFIIITLPSEIDRWWLVHVGLPLVVPEHHLAVQLQLRAEGKEQVSEDIVSSPQRGCSGGGGVCSVPGAPAPTSNASRTYCTI